MIRREGLGRKIVVRMAMVTLSGLVISALCAFFVYSWVFENHPDVVAAPHEWVPQPVDYVVIALSGLLAVGIAVVAAIQLSRRIVLPLTALAESARRIADGDLSARAEVSDRSLGETTVLVDDFNLMAERLQRHADGMAAWNASIAHELRTPVTILKGRLQGVADGVFDMDDRTLTSLLRQVDGLARLVEDLRVVSLGDSGHLDLRLEYVDLAQVVGELREAVQPALAEAGFGTVWNLAPAAVVCDPTRMRQAALALIENARIHATPGALKICTEVDGATVRILIEDAGPGVDADLAAVLFQPFQRNPARATGSGLGLAVVRAVAEAHGGRAFHRTAAQGGSIFTLEIPATQ